MKGQPNSMIYKKKRPLLVFLIPSFAFMAVYLFYPFVLNIINSFQRIDSLGQSAKGFNTPWYANYVQLVQDPKVATSLLNTLFMMLCTIVFQVGVALVLALLVDSIKVGGQFFRTVFFFPIVISATAIGAMFNIVFAFEGGLINSLFKNIGLISSNIDFKGGGGWFATMATPVMWQYVGFYFVIIVTGLNNISSDIYEAATIDGATNMQVVFKIKLPLLYNTLCTCLILAITGALKVFDLPWTMFPNGVPLDSSWLTGTYMYAESFNAKNVDYGSTLSILIVILGVVISQVVNTVFKEKDY